MNPTSGFCVMILFVCVFTFGKAAPTAGETYTRTIDLTVKCKANEADNKTVLQFQVPSSDTGKCLMLCFLKELDMLDSTGKYEEAKSYMAFRNFWSMFSDEVLKSVNTAAAEFARGIDSKSGTCDYGYEVMKFINADFIKKQLLTTTTTTTSKP